MSVWTPLAMKSYTWCHVELVALTGGWAIIFLLLVTLDGQEQVTCGMLFEHTPQIPCCQASPSLPTVLPYTYLSRVRESSVYSGRSFKSLGEAESWCRLIGRAWPSLLTTSRPVRPR